MANPKIADTKPSVLELEPGVYFWCTCKHSARGHLCDGAHTELE